MKTVSLREMQHHLSEVIRSVDQGQEVVVTRRNRAIARVIPIKAAAPLVWPDFDQRSVRIQGKTLSQAILDDRD
jgi:prevent-host-death family protein